jgi:hypothetical protein
MVVVDTCITYIYIELMHTQLRMLVRSESDQVLVQQERAWWCSVIATTSSVTRADMHCVYSEVTV